MTKVASILSRGVILPYVIIVLAAFNFGAVLQAGALPAAEAEIGHLLSYLKHSDCRFYRNGIWYSASEARAHLERKYRYLIDQDSTAAAEEFIDRAATGSGMSGKTYQVKCAGTEQIPSAVWLNTELKRLRQASAVRSP